jgi:hemerythrin
MESFNWSAVYETGLTDIDDQHRMLVDLINRLGTELVENDMQSKQVEAIVEELTDYAKFHFESEELLMADAGISARHIENHIEEHKRFLADVMSMSGSMHADNGGKSLLEFLIFWLAHHILGLDQNMARQKIAIEQGIASNDAFLSEEQKTIQATNPLLAALGGLFQQVSARNRELCEMNRSLEAKVTERTRELLQANADLEILAMTDLLTDLPNRRHGMRQLRELWKESEELGTELSCIVIDADGFKEVNDTYGHDAGDVVLKRLARELRQSVRTDDVVCRMGGDEFLIICPSTSLRGAIHVAEQTRSNVAALTVEAGEGSWKGSISVGVATNSGGGIESIDELLKAADDGVYKAKREGRNCVRTRQVLVI